jgi:hypothetical protein
VRKISNAVPSLLARYNGVPSPTSAHCGTGSVMRYWGAFLLQPGCGEQAISVRAR